MLFVVPARLVFRHLYRRAKSLRDVGADAKRLARKLLEHHGIPYRAIEVDSVEYQQGNRGGKLRNALRERTGWATLPQIFVGGEFVGGATDLFDECIKGRLQARLAAQRIELKEPIVDPYGFLPKWLQPRSRS